MRYWDKNEMGRVFLIGQKKHTRGLVSCKLVHESRKEQTVIHYTELIPNERIPEEGEGLAYIKFKIMLLVIIKIIVNEMRGNSWVGLILQGFQRVIRCCILFYVQYTNSKYLLVSEIAVISPFMSGITLLCTWCYSLNKNS